MQNWNNDQAEERSIDLSRLLKILWKRAWIIVAATVIFAAAAYIYSTCFITPTYRTSFTAYVNNRDIDGTGSTSTSDLSASMGLMYVYQKIVTSRTVLIEAAKQCDMYGTSYGSVSDMVKAYVSETAPVLTVFVETTDPAMCKQLADVLAEIAPQHVARVVEGSTMSLIDPPYTPTTPYTPDKPENTLFGALTGLILSTVVLLAFELICDNVSGAEELESRYQIPVIGNIPDLHQTEKNGVKFGNSREGSRRK